LKPPVFRPAAAADVEEAHLWYERQRSGLGDELLRTLQLSVDEVAANPEAFPIVHRDTRRALVRRFPYALFYRVVGDQIVVIACFHAKRNPRSWQARR
jgi:plasmid stabilization system protein ParE